MDMPRPEYRARQRFPLTRRGRDGQTQHCGSWPSTVLVDTVDGGVPARVRPVPVRAGADRSDDGAAVGFTPRRCVVNADERRGLAKGSTQEVLPGVVVSRSTSGAVSVIDHGRFAGWLHASSGATWNAFAPPGTHLGKFTLRSAARVIVTAYHARKAG